MDDFNQISKISFGNITNFKHICEYLRKACIALHNITEPEYFFKQHITIHTKEQLITLTEFVKACHHLSIVPEVC